MVENVVVDPIMGIHIFAGIGALFIGIALIFLVSSEEGRNKLARFWQGTMLVLVVTSFDIKVMNNGEFSPVHGLSIIVLLLILMEVWASLTQRIRVQKYSRIASFVMLVIILGAIVSTPGGVINQWFFT